MLGIVGYWYDLHIIDGLMPPYAKADCLYFLDEADTDVLHIHDDRQSDGVFRR